MRYVRVENERRLAEELEHPGATILCGGTDLVVKMRAGKIRPDRLIDIHRVDSLRGVRTDGADLWIGAATTEREILEAPLVREHFPLLAETLVQLGSAQIRSRGSLGGNLVNASPAADSAVPLLLYDARLDLVGPGGERTLPLRDFLVAPGRTSLRQAEYVRAVRIPLPERPWTTFFHKVGKRQALTIAIASLGGLAHVSEGRIDALRLAAGSVAPTPIRLDDVETMLHGEQPTPEIIARACATTETAVSPIDDIRATAAYRATVVGRLVQRFLEHLASG